MARAGAFGPLLHGTSGSLQGPLGNHRYPTSIRQPRQFKSRAWPPGYTGCSRHLTQQAMKGELQSSCNPGKCDTLFLLCTLVDLELTSKQRWTPQQPASEVRLDTETWTRSPGGSRAPGGPAPLEEDSWVCMGGGSLWLQRTGLHAAQDACLQALAQACVGMSTPWLVAAQPPPCSFLGVESLCSLGFLSCVRRTMFSQSVSRGLARRSEPTACLSLSLTSDLSFLSSPVRCPASPTHCGHPER